MRLEGRVALITGGGRGIGREIALAFAREGADIAVASRTEAQVRAVAEECAALGVRAIAVPLDVADPEACRRAVEGCVDELGRLDILVNNAGILEAGRFLLISDEVWERTLQVDLTGAFYMTRAALPAMLERGDGAVISISSIAGKVGHPYGAPYAVAKAGLNGLMRTLAMEYARSGVTFNAVCPSYTETDMVADAVEGIVQRTGRNREKVLATMRAPIGRLITTQDVAALCVLLAGPEGRAINGQAINVDGGWVHA